MGKKQGKTNPKSPKWVEDHSKVVGRVRVTKTSVKDLMAEYTSKLKK